MAQRYFCDICGEVIKAVDLVQVTVDITRYVDDSEIQTLEFDIHKKHQKAIEKLIEQTFPQADK